MSVIDFYHNHQWLCDMAIATTIGALIGLERELRLKPAGVRTYSLVCLASYLFTYLSIHAGGDPGRLAANIITGIGFLGSAVVLHRDAGVEGVTTAGSLFLMAGVGMAIGFGFIKIAIVSVIFSLIVMEVFGWIVWRYKHNTHTK